MAPALRFSTVPRPSDRRRRPPQLRAEPQASKRRRPKFADHVPLHVDLEPKATPSVASGFLTGPRRRANHHLEVEEQAPGRGHLRADDLHAQQIGVSVAQAVAEGPKGARRVCVCVCCCARELSMCHLLLACPMCAYIGRLSQAGLRTIGLYREQSLRLRAPMKHRVPTCAAI